MIPPTLYFAVYREYWLKRRFVGFYKGNYTGTSYCMLCMLFDEINAMIGWTDFSKHTILSMRLFNYCRTCKNLTKKKVFLLVISYDLAQFSIGKIKFSYDEILREKFC